MLRPPSPARAGTPAACRSRHLLGGVAVLALLSACAGQPQMTEQQEAKHYKARAHRSYTAPGPADDPWGPYIAEAGKRFDVPERWIREVMRQESGGRLYGRNGDLVTSHAGAMGLMQVMPGTYDELRARYPDLGEDPYDPHNNILAGTAYLREMYDIYGSPGFLAAYNAGPGRLDDHLTRNRPLPMETRRYVASIGPRIRGAEPRRASPGEQYAMNALPSAIPAGPRYARLGRGTPYNGPVFAMAQPPQPDIPAQPIVLRPMAPQSFAQAGFAQAPVVQAAEAPADAAPAKPIVLRPPAPAFAQAGEPAPAASSAGAIVLNPPAPQMFAQADAPTPPARPIVLNPPAPSPAPAPSFAGVDAPAFPSPVAQPFVPPAPTRPAGSLALARAEAPPARVPSGPSARPGVQVAALPEPPIPVPPPPAAPQPASLASAPKASRGLGLISPAMAEPAGRRPGAPGATGGGWAVQVGAFANQALASAAASAAREQARPELSAARPLVAFVRQGSSTLYRARLTGLSRDAAAQACERLSRGKTTCMIVSPDAQS